MFISTSHKTHDKYGAKYIINRRAHLDPDLTNDTDICVGFKAWYIILPLIEILKFDWLRQILYAEILCFLTNLIFLIYPLHVTY